MSRIAAVLLAALTTAPAAGPSVLCVLKDARITEASGIGISRLHHDTVYVQNDSGDSARFFAVSTRSGRTAAVFSVPGARNVDWEDLAVARVAGRDYVYLADIGDNDAVRSEVDVYRVPEPASLASGRTATPVVWRLRYPAGPVNAESFAVTPSGAAYIVTKAADGRSEVYTLPTRPDRSKVQVLRRIGSFHAEGFGTAGKLATGASFSADGTLFAIRTYLDAYVWHVHGGNLAAALRTAPTRIALPLQPQGEGVAIGTGRLLIDSEGTHSAVLAVPLPPAPVPASASASPLTFQATRHSGSPGAVVGAVAGGAALAAAALAGIVLRRRGRRT